MPKDNPLFENSVDTFHYMFDCQRRYPPHSCSQSVIRLQQSAQAPDADNFSRIINRMFGLDDPAQRLMNPFVMIVFTILPKRIFQLRHGRQNQIIRPRKKLSVNSFILHRRFSRSLRRSC